ncbi:uncharacterized protein [Hemitrygon akajei]|uniref:uncharacterized protein n=1 Tax=Hemitrygon akajei TaxID=2704970 RepID=UPI003BFA21F6
MDARETYMNVIFANPYPRTPSRDGLTCTYSELMFGKGEPPSDHDVESPVASGPGEWPITAQTDCLNATYSVVILPKEEPLIDENEDPPIASGPAEITESAQADGLNSTDSVLNLPKDEYLVEEYEDPPIASGPADMSVTAQAGPRKREPNENIGNRPHRKIRLLYIVISVLVAIVIGLSIHVTQLRQSQITIDRNYHEFNSTLQSKIAEISALNSNLTDLKRRHSDLRHQFTEMETKYRSVNETKAQICELLTSRREQACSKDWIRNEDLCYFISTFTIPYGEAKELCSHLHSKLLEINSTEEEKFVTKAVEDQDSAFWVGKCKVGEAASNVVYKVNAGKFECSECKSGLLGSCKNDQHRFICEKPAPLCPDIPEKIPDLCQKPVEPT